MSLQSAEALIQPVLNLVNQRSQSMTLASGGTTVLNCRNQEHSVTRQSYTPVVEEAVYH